MDIIIHNAAQIVTVAARGARSKAGGAMRDVGLIEAGSLGIEAGRIVYVGPAAGIDPGQADQLIDATGKVLLPGFVDSHTHLLFAGTREEEFVMRNAGATYAEIAAAGGGINTTVRATRAATDVELMERALERLDSALAFGTTTIEIKSGYGLDRVNELRMLSVIRELRGLHVVDIVPTFLGAHTIPFDYRDRRQEYVDLLVRKMIPEVGERGLAEFCDVFCEEHVFSLEESRLILATALRHGMKCKLHADQLTPLGGSMLAAEVGAVSADHLDHVSDEGIGILKEAGTIATLLPGVSLFLGEPMADARRLIDAGLPVALATDFNPGSCMSENIQLMMSLGAMQMRMTPEEVICAVTLNGAAALDRADDVGSLEVGKRADALLFDVPNYAFIPYHFGVNHLVTVILNGRTVLEKSFADA